MNQSAFLRPVDTLNGKAPHKRHRAVINQIRVPIGDRVYNGEIAATRCGRYLRYFNRADDVSLLCTDGSVYSVECAACFN